MHYTVGVDDQEDIAMTALIVSYIAIAVVFFVLGVVVTIDDKTSGGKRGPS